ncbi:hypothetical protein HG530_003914 [Fusarium avenaceum]|nr:hypothetical protein HG530_003914 [Fusarium avenaceum]
MPDYVLDISIQARSFNKQLSQQGLKICFAFAIKNEGYKVIASSMDIESNAQLRWNDEFSIAASSSSFENGVRVSAATSPKSISLGQSYTLAPNWEDSVTEDGPRDGIRFNNEASQASVIVYRTINGSKAPIYISSNKLRPGSSQEIKLSNRVAVWYQHDGQTGTMIDGPGQLATQFDMSGRTQATLVFTEDREWSLQ